ncbi:DMT family transporter [Allokutzneria sp. A3M-2-11 16]|uniref:DMT family transporter n=1 Tax=Allokutzneria sp. A3M-2-11 16 TaxID=2962043 RepID=UPI0020B738FE|nr:DMT family transporter [Allokutzneria sp. A3M-2-11 16]MCP3798772.1 DMT family transporter [Allokutzneria sp. A3M-2-11 16]
MLAALGTGMLLAVQSRINGELADRMGDGLTAALISFGSGLLVLLVLVLALPAGRRGVHRVREALSGGALSWWHCTGGVCGAVFVLSQGLTITSLGVAVFTVAVVTGQAASSLAVDRAGIGSDGPRPLSGNRIAGAGLAVVAVMIAVSDRFEQPSLLWLAALPLLAGIGMGWQQAANGLVRARAGSALLTAMINFLVGTLALTAVLLVRLLVVGAPVTFPGEPWLYIGGVLGTIAIGAAAALVSTTGVLLFGLGQVAGQLVGALLLDLVVPAAGDHLTAATVLGTLLTVAAVGIAALPRRATR